jgi:glucose-specific phosphotransferase system IIA component
LQGIGFLQQFGRALMLPTLTLPVAAIFLWFGQMPWEYIGVSSMADLFKILGHLIFAYMPLVFAVGIALGLTQNSIMTGMSGLVGYFLFTHTIQFYASETIDFGVGAGIFIGLVAVSCYHMTKKIVFPEYMQFFGGSRMVPLCTSIIACSAGLFVAGILPYLLIVGHELSTTLLQLGGFGAFLYGVVARLFVSTGLHHIVNNLFWFQVGSYDTPTQGKVYGDLLRFFAGDPSAGIYMTGMYPITLFGLPAIAIAIIQESRSQFKLKVKTIFLTAALTCFVTGVTEPIEFAFLFVAPYLFLIHAFLSGTAMWITYELGIHHGFSFSAGAIDFIVNYHLSQRGLWLIPIGFMYFIIYYVIFRVAIRQFNLPTPGREQGTILEVWAKDIPTRAQHIIQALGGQHNILHLDACMTRLRMTVAHFQLVDRKALKKLGSAGVIHLGSGNIQVVFGTYAEVIKEEMMNILKLGLQHISFSSPVNGRMISLLDVNDPIYANKIVGEGVAFIPESGECVSPIQGKIVHIFPTGHALGIQTDGGLHVLLHIGIDSIHFKGFELFVKEGEYVQQGQLLVKFDLNELKRLAKSTETMMMITNPELVRHWTFSPYTYVRQGQSSIMSVELKSKPV